MKNTSLKWLLCFIADFFTSMDLGHLFTILKASLQIMVEGMDTPTTRDISFHKLVQISGALYCISDVLQIPMDLGQFLIFLVSIPWLARCDPPWSDLPHKFGLSVDAMVRVGMSLGPVINKESMKVCLHFLAAFSSDAAPTWRTQVFLLVLVMIILFSLT